MRAVVYILILALVIGLIATMVSSALASPRPTASTTPAAATEDTTQSTTASTTTSAAPSPAAVDPASAQTSEPGGEHGELGPVVVLGTVDLTWADLLAAADSDDPSLSSAAKALLTYAGAGRPVNLVTRTVGERTCPADGWLTLGAGARVRAAEHSGDGSAECHWPADWAEAAEAAGSAGTAGTAGTANATTARAGTLAGVLAREGTTTAAVGRGGVLALTNGDTIPDVGDSASELLAREDPPDLIIADTVPQSADPGDTGDAADPAGTASTAGSAPDASDASDASDADRILALATALEPLADAPAGTRVVVASVADATDPSPQLAILPPRTRSPLKTSTGALVGPSTHRRGLIQLTDLAPALFLGVTDQKPGPYWSQPLEIAPELREQPTDGALGTGSVSSGVSQARPLADDALHAQASQRANVPAGLVLIGAALALGLAAARVLRAPRAATGGEPQPATSEEPQTTTDEDPQPAARGRAGGEQPRPATAPDPSEAPDDSPAADSMGPAVSTPSDTGTIPTGPPRRRLRVVTWAACLITALPAGLWLANMLPWWRTGNATAAALGLALAFAVASVTVTAAAARVALALMRRLRPQAPRRLLTELGIVGAGNGRGSTTPQDLAALISSLLLVALTAVVIFYDAGYRAPIAFNGPLGMNAVVAGRFYGMSNTAFALAAASLLVTIAAWAGPLVAAQQGSRESRHAAAVALVAFPGVMALILDAAPEMGADIGGALTLVPALVALGAGLAGVRLGWRRWVAVGAAAVGIVLLLGLIDFLFGGSSTHLGGFFNQLLTGTAGATLTRKATALIAPFISNWLAVAALAVGVSVIALIGRWAMRAVHEARQGNGPYAWLTGPGVLPQWLRPLGRALAVLVIVEVLVNDSGLVMLWFSAAAAVPALTAILAARLAAAGSAGPAEAVTAPASPSAPTAAGE